MLFADTLACPIVKRTVTRASDMLLTETFVVVGSRAMMLNTVGQFAESEYRKRDTQGVALNPQRSGAGLEERDTRNAAGPR
jgi:hypothetical protein